MRNWIIASIMVFPVFCRADDFMDQRSYQTYSTEDMFNIVTGALLKRDDVKLLLKNSEDWGLRQIHSIGIDEKYVEPVVLGAAPLIFHKVSTKSLHFHWEPVKDLTLRPDVEYYLDSKEFNALFTIGWKF